MNNNQYLSEERYQKTSKKLNIIGMCLLFTGFVGIILAIVMQIFEANNMLYNNNAIPYICGFSAFISIPMIGIGIFLLISSKQRQMSAYMIQQQMPIAQEGLEKMSPSMGNAAKEIAKGVKEGLKDDVIKLNGDPNFYQAMTDEEDRQMIENSIFISGKQEGIKQGIEQGTRRGIEENQKSIVKNMKDANYKVEDIAKITGLSVQEIKKI